jgi:MFS family permease
VTGSGHPDAPWSQDRRALTTGLVLTVTLVALEALAVATVMPVVARDLGGIALYGWVFSAFFLGDLVGIVVAGQQADRGGLVRPYLLGLGMFATGLVIGGAAPSMPVLVVGRAVQGFGAGAIPAVAYVSIRRQFPPSLRPRMFAIMSTAWVVPGLVGPAAAGIVADHLSWRAVFLGLLPFVGLAAALTVPSIASVPGRRDADAHVDGEAPAVRSDGSGPEGERPARRLLAALRVAAGAALLLAALDAREPLVAAPLAAVALPVGLPALRILLPEGALRAHPGLPATVLLRGILTFGFTAAETFVPLMLVSVRGTSASAAGLALTAATITWSVGAWLQARWVGTWGAGRLIRIGFALVATGIVIIAAVTSTAVPSAVAVAAWGVSGLGMGMSYAPITLLVLHLAPGGREGAATAALQLSDVLGTALGAGAGGAIVALGAAMAWDPRTALVLTFGMAGVAAASGLLVTARLGAASAPGAVTRGGGT